MEDEINLSPKGEVVYAAMIDLERHLETHHCSECFKKYQTFTSAVTYFVQLTQPTEKGVEHEEAKSEAPKEQSEKPEGESEKASEDWDIFGPKE